MLSSMKNATLELEDSLYKEWISSSLNVDITLNDDNIEVINVEELANNIINECFNKGKLLAK